MKTLFNNSLRRFLRERLEANFDMTEERFLEFWLFCEELDAWDLWYQLMGGAYKLYTRRPNANEKEAVIQSIFYLAERVANPQAKTLTLWWELEVENNMKSQMMALVNYFFIPEISSESMEKNFLAILKVAKETEGTWSRFTRVSTDFS